MWVGRARSRNRMEMTAGTGQSAAGDDDGGVPPQWLLAFGRLFDPHPSQVAMLDLGGTVLAVNAAWRQFGRANGLRDGYDAVGQNYLAVCEAAVVEGCPWAKQAYVGLVDVIRNGRPKFTLLYSCRTSDRHDWYRLWVEPQTPSVPAVIVAHQLVESKPVAADGPGGVGSGATVPPSGPLSDAGAALQPAARAD